MAIAKKIEKRARVTRQHAAVTAIECFKRYGVHRTSMNDIADMLGVSRQTLYRLFESRSELLEYIATGRVEILTEKLSKFVAKYDRLADAIVDGLAYSVKLGRNDELLAEILRQEGDAHFTTFMFGGTEEVQISMLTAWGPLIRKAREDGELDAGITDIQAIEWICNIGAVLNIREDYNEADHRRILQQFVRPSLASGQPSDRPKDD